MRKQELKKFLLWLRNGTSIGITWFLLLLLGMSCAARQTTVSTVFLAKAMLLIFGGVFLFCAAFTKLFFVRQSFFRRLSLFVLILGAYQTAGFYWLGIFSTGGSALQWGAYLLILFASYLCGLMIYRLYAARKGKLYTQALLAYQRKREKENEK